MKMTSGFWKDCNIVLPLWFDVKAHYGWKSHILAAIKEVSIFYFSEINPFLGVTVV